mmetsp:Transcript_20388/g.37853  ORF Transcript_20388/g.37853 Transcript_20388/m.37853 type:complete len:750 (+) Transcript_20388:167-2416(+)|eukprot:CAMPEP_0114436288 /NCGR_PEP_ID=MMETSP0103-20121206/13360_1 /TAXON_ID=37642 ORGANISM="Paraphysomonas imperforata, Strain PA2" /NCGR_SAMPLE_ID=MMETSP0103 /ASSEMBLY_ACC=CAM_ASM_000201 /LENGTH=749 /DNA_ID=CAMNT_0001606523 /DNA_START=94 /DNA_END=2343 /DNA_ORIENTATION=+
MFDPDEERVVIDDYMECLAIEDFTATLELGRDRGRTPDPTESQKKTLEKLANKLYHSAPKTKKGEDEAEDVLDFDFLDTTRVMLFDSKVQKKSQNSFLVQHLSSRHMFLFNDVIVITSFQTNKLKRTERYSIHQVIPLDSLSIHPASEDEPNNSSAFSLHTADRVYCLIAESESDKVIWLEEIELALFAWHRNTPFTQTVDWLHKTILGTLHSDCLLGNIDRVRVHLDAFAAKDESPDCVDRCGMCPLHWAALNGQNEVIDLLLDAGSDIDVLNAGLNSALLVAASRGHDSTIRLLLERGADISIRNLKDRDVLFMAVLYGHRSKGLQNALQVLQYNHIDFDQVDSTGATPLHECAARNLCRPVFILVEAGASVNCKHGRSGVTPLQLACSLENPDIETVRSFLENGAHPNWKDASGKSAFNMVLNAHSGVVTQSTAPPPAAGDGAPLPEDVAIMRERVAKFGMWVQQALPVLLEIVRKGGRYTESSVASLRPSFQEAIDSARLYWHTFQLPPNFEDFVLAKREQFEKVAWVGDSASDHCMLCVDKFSYSNRRHHCRACGILCCAPCSSKRMVLKPKNTSASPSKPPPPGDRVCDGCYNRLVYLTIQRNAAIAKAKKDLAIQQKKEQEELDKKGDSGHNKSKLFGAFGSSGNLESEKDEFVLVNSSSNGSLDNEGVKKSGSGSNIAGLQNTLGEVGADLEERGEKLNTLAQKSEALDNAAAQYNNMAKQLLVQQQERAAALPSWRKKKK